MRSINPVSTNRLRLAGIGAAIALLTSTTQVFAADAGDYCLIEVKEQGTGWPVPLVELRTTHHLRFVTDNAGRIALDAPELMGQETWFSVIGHGYEVKPDGFGMRGVRLTPIPGETLTVNVVRTSIAKRLGRLTGGGLFAESQKLGLERQWQESRILGCDSVQNAVYRGRLFWAWGDTTLAKYPLGLFHMTSATTAVAPLESLEPPLRLPLDYFTDDQGRPRVVAPMKGEGPTWLGGYMTLPNREGVERLVATYAKIRPPMSVYETGLCVWNDETEQFDHLKTLWTRSSESPEPPPMPGGHPVVVKDDAGQPWALFGNPLPTLRCPATFEAWQDPAAWEEVDAQETLTSAADGATVRPHSGSIAWNEFRQRWVTVFMETFGKPSAFGEIWYAEAPAATGPWGPAVKVLSHDNYTFYNPRIHPELSPEGSPVLIFEGTFTEQFTDRAQATPRYDYNQMIYRLDLDDPRLAPVQADAP